MKKLLLLLSFAFFVNCFCTIAQPCTNPTGPAGDDCASATPICDPILGIDEYCDQLDGNNIPSNFPGCPANVLNNDEWFVFVASGPFLDLTVIPTNCQNLFGQEGVQAALYEGSCTGDPLATQCACTTSPFTLSASTTPGQTYYFVIDGCAGDICDYEIQENNGATIPTAPPDVLPDGPIQVCPNLISNYSLIDLNTGAPISNGDIYTWTLSDPTLGEFQTIPPMGASIDIQWLMEGTVEICATGVNACGLSSTVPPPQCLTVNIEQPPDVNDMTEGCIGDQVECFAAPGFSQVVTPNPYSVTIPLIDPAGCAYNVICLVEPIIVPPVDLGQVELCGPASFEMCPGLTKFDTGIYVEDCVDPVLGCPGQVTVDLAIFEPLANIAQPVPELDCGSSSTVMLDGSGSTLFSPAPGATVTLDWTGPGIVGSNTDPFVTVDTPGEYCLTVTMSRNGNECSATACVTVTQNDEVPNAPVLTGEQEPCEGILYTYDGDITGNPAPTSYGWVTPNGEPFTVVDINTIEIDWTGSMGGDLCVFGINDCGNGDTTCVNITISESPNIPVVDGPEDVCAVNQTETYTITNVQANVTYAWTVPNGASFNGSGSTITVNFDGADLGPGQVCATATNDCGTSDAGCFNVNISAPPPTPDMTGPTSVCSNGTGYTYTVSNGQTGDTYTWTAPTGATINGTGSSVDIDFNGSQSGQVCVTISNECGTSDETCLSVTVIQTPTATISGSGELCEGVPEDIDLTITITGSAAPWDITYTLDGMNPTMITVPSSPHTLTVNQPGVYELTNLSSSGGCSGTVNGQATITENPLPTAELSGMDGICENSGDVGELTVVLTGEAPWTIDWESNGVGQASVVANATPYTLNVSEAQAGTITLTGVTDNNDCEGTVSGTGTITVLQAPVVSSVERTCNATNTEYTVTITIQGGDPASYSVSPANGNLNGNTFVSNLIFSGLGYSFTISDANDCDPVLVEGTFECNCESMAGDMDLTPVETCGDGPIDASGLYDNTGEFLDGDDALEFILHSGNGTTIVSPIVGEYTVIDNISFDPATMTYGETYHLSAVVGNDDGSGGVDLTDPCLSVSLGTPITFFEIPTATLDGMDEVCEGDDANLTVSFTGVSPWAFTYDDGAGNTFTLTGINSNPYDLIVTPPSIGLNTITLTDMNDGHCPGDVSGTGEVTVNTGVMVDNLMVTCNSTATGFVVTFNITGGDPASYTVTGLSGDIQNGLFTSDEIPTGPGVGFSAVVTDTNDCDPQTVSQTEVICDCTSDAGLMDQDTVTACGDGPITVPDATGTMLDGDDLQLYYLHIGSGVVLNSVIATNTVPTFSFDPATMTYGTTYRVSSVIGNMDGSGGIDLLDPCLSVAQGTPIIFYEIPTATISGGTLICPGDGAELMIELTGDSPWSVTVNGQVYDNINGSPYTLQVDPDMTTTYQLTAVSDNNCDNTLMDEQTVTVHDPPTVTLDSEDCNLTGTAYTVCFTITGGDNTCYQVTPNTGTLTGNQFCSDPIPSGDGYSFSVIDCQDCPPAVISALEVSCDCPTVAGDLVSAPLGVCRNEMTPSDITYDATNEVLDPDDALCFALYNGNVVLATNPNNTAFSFNPGNMMLGQVYQICPIAGNDDGAGCVDLSDPCFNRGGCVDVVFNPLPTATMSGTVDICAGDMAMLTVDFTGTGPWEITYQNAGGTPTTETAMTSPYILQNVAPVNSTIISLTSVTDANGCTNSIAGNSATVNVNQPPTATNITEDCNVLETEFTVSFTISGGSPGTYNVDPPGGAIVGDTYTSAFIPTGSTYTFFLDDANGCGPTVVQGGHACDCFTQVGTMVTTPLVLCGNELTPGNIYNDAGELLDANDIKLFLLMSFNSPIFNPVNVIDVNPTEPVFGFNPATMSYGTTYYIATLIGNDDGSGGIDPTDLCLSFSNFTQVRFFPLPNVTATAPAAICEGEEAIIELTVTGVPPYNIDYIVNGIPGTIINGFPVGNVIEVSLPLPVTSLFTLVSIDDSNCSNTASQSLTIEVNPQVEAGTAIDSPEYCQGENQTVQLIGFISGADMGGTWTTQTGQAIPNGSLNVGTLPVGVNTLTYSVSGTAPCPDDAVELIIVITENPVADAGPDLSLDCNSTSLDLSVGSGTTPGAIVTWSGPGIIDPNNPNPTVSNPGLFTLTATIGQCTDIDELIVSLNVSTPEAIVQPNPVSCFGETDGFVIVETVEGGEPPYLFSLDGGPFIPQQSFLGLAPGTHSITVEDDLGCRSTTSFEIEEPVEVTVQLTGNFAGIDPTVELGESITLTAFTTPGVGALDTILWFPAGVDSTCLGCPQITVTPTQQTSFLVVVDANGCRAEDTLTIAILKPQKPWFVPNAFSPNDDLINDRLHVFASPFVAQVKSFLIFNRWGEAVFEFYNFQPAPRDYSVGWDGKHREEFMNPGVFTWFAEFELIDGTVKLDKGDISLMRNN